MKMIDAPEIEQQHQQLVSMFNRLNNAVKGRASREEIYQIIDEVIAFTIVHFATEERIMAKSGYPEIAAHQDKHRQLIEEALHLKEKLNYVGEAMFTEWFNHWPFARVLAHIQYADKQIELHIMQNRGG
jgi:hemerythrin